MNTANENNDEFGEFTENNNEDKQINNIIA
jgi:hypothetical protein